MQTYRSAGGLQRPDGRMSSSPALSTPPDSPARLQSHSQFGAESVQLGTSRPATVGVDFLHDSFPQQKQRLALSPHPPKPTKTSNTPSTSTTAPAITTTSTANPPAKNPRKKREQPATDADRDTEGKPKEKKARKPREARHAQNSNGAKAPAGQVAAAAAAANTPVSMPTAPPTALNNTNTVPPTHSMPFAARRSPEARPASSGQHFDPVRSVSMEAAAFASKTSPGTTVRSPLAHTTSAASAAASIHSLIDPVPMTTASSSKNLINTSSSSSVITSAAAPISPSHQMNKPLTFSTTATPSSLNSQQSTANGQRTPTGRTDAAPTAPFQPPQQPSDPTAMDIDPPIFNSASTAATAAAETSSNAVKKTKSEDAATPSITAPVSTPPSNKSTRQREISLPPLPGVGGAGGILGPTSAPNGAYGVNICLHFDLRGKEGVTLSFAREVEKKYGKDALHPRRAAHRDRMARMAAATAALEKDSGSGSAQDVSDLSEPEQEPDSTAEMMVDDGANGINGVNGHAEKGKGGRKKRRPNKNEYNLDDDFIDDAELAWEEQAAVAAGGFFVYSGPLVTEEEKPAVERANGTAKRGRGRGRGTGTSSRGETSGRGSRGGRGGGGGSGGGGGGGGSNKSNDGASTTANGNEKSTTGTSGSTGRGGQTANGGTRKPRVKKAERLEKAERELAEKKRAEAEALKVAGRIADGAKEAERMLALAGGAVTVE